ncbi:MAG TPA: hypothetical protein VK508_20135 [Cyclobacteriaceae bacterium]|nr:hypothetical protein [Cyclobacteriaceae bacterium]
MTFRLLFFLTILAVVSCKDKDEPQVCDVEDPVNELQWLKDKAAEIQNSEFSAKYFYIEEADYNGQVVFYVNNCCPMCTTFITYYDCSGTPLEEVDASQVKNGRRIWTPEGLECVFYN